MTMASIGEIQIEPLGSEKFALTVMIGEQRFDCGYYVSRPAALTAGRLFITRKENERKGRAKTPRPKR